MDPFVSMFQTFLEVLVATILAYTGYEIYERRLERHEKTEILKSLRDIHGAKTIADATDDSQDQKQGK